MKNDGKSNANHKKANEDQAIEKQWKTNENRCKPKENHWKTNENH